MELKGFWRRLVDVVIGVIIGFLMAWDIVFARSIDMSKAGVTLWIFIAVGAFIILLQLIPAFILFTAFIAAQKGHRHEKVEEVVQTDTAKETNM